MIAAYVRSHVDETLRVLRAYQYALHTRPLLTGSLSVIALVVVLTLAGALPAYAAAAGSTWDTELTDSNGTAMSAYQNLPLDSAPSLTNSTWLQALIASWTWGFSWHSSQVLLKGTQFVLEFEWIEWLSTPLAGLAQLIHGLFVSVGWVPLALTITGLVAGFAMLRGRIAAGFIEICLSAVAVALLATVLSNPTEYLTGPDGGFATVQSWGSQLSARLVSGGDATFSDVLTAPLVDIVTTTPYQHISFGHALAPDCFATLQNALATNPDDGGYIRDEVRRCDEEAAETADTPLFDTIWLALVSNVARFGLFSVTALLCVVLVALVLWTLWDSIRLAVGAFIAVLPGGKAMAMKSAFNMLTGLLSILLAIVLIVVGLKFVVGVLGFLEGRLPFEYQMNFIGLVMVVLAFIAIYVIVRARKISTMLAERAAQAGLGRAELPSSGMAGTAVKALDWTSRLARHAMDLKYASNANKSIPAPPQSSPLTTTAEFSRLQRPPASDLPSGTSPRGRLPLEAGGAAATSPAPPTPHPTGGPEQQQATFSKMPSKPGDAAQPKGAAAKQAARAVAGSAGRIAIAAAVSGPAGAGAQAAREAGSYALNAVASKTRRITVDASGAGTVRPVPATPLGAGRFDISSLPPRRAIG